METHRPSPTSIIAALALFFALGGTALATRIAPPAPSASSASAAIAAPPGANGDVTCNQVAPNYVPNNLIVPEGRECFIVAGTQVGNDVQVEPNAFLFDLGGSVGHDISANHPTSVIVTSQSKVGNDINIDGSQFGGFLCATQVGHEVVLRDGGMWTVGDLDLCGPGGGVSVVHNLVAENNRGVDISDNNPTNNGGIGHDLTVLNNGVPIVESDKVAHNATCTPTATTDGDEVVPNQVGHSDNGCG